MARTSVPTLASASDHRDLVPPPRARDAYAAWINPVCLAAFFAVLTIWSWRKWPDVLVDFGQQLYIPWQLAIGKHLFTDIALMHGPLSQYFNAIWFRLFGPSLAVLIVVNITILAGIATGLYVLVRRSSDRLTAGVACAVFLGVFAFSQYVSVGNYNFVSPYVHEATHGIALAVGMLLCFGGYFTRGSRVACAGAGFCLGFVILTKVDIAVAAIAMAAVAAVVAGVFQVRDGRARAFDALLFVGCTTVPPAAFFLYFITYLSARDAVATVFAGFTVLSSAVADNPFYRHVLGVDDIGGNVAKMAWMSGAIVLVAIVGAVTDMLTGRSPGRVRLVSVVAGVGLFAVLVASPDLVPWPDLPRALPITTLLALAMFGVVLLRSRRHDVRSMVAPMLLLATFALGLLAKMALNARVFHYGFYLAMPATLVLAVCLTYWVPAALRARSVGSGRVFRALAVAVLAAAVVFHLRASQDFYAVKDFPVGKGGDTILANRPQVRSPAPVVAAALNWMEQKMPPSATFVALPEGITLNYLSRHETTLRQMNFMMTEMIVFGEPAIVAGLDAHPPDYVLLVDKDTSEFGVGPFGKDPRYGKLIMDWVGQHYDPIVLIGHEPFEGSALGIKILKRRPA